MIIKYCKKCVMPNTRPKLTFDNNGICDACRFAESKKEIIDWTDRERQLKAILDKFRRKNDEIKYDCIVPVSGGKDSTYQVHIIKNVYKMNPLCITFRTDARTALGERNLQNLREMGVDHIDFTPNPVGFNKFRLKSLIEVGDCSLPDHLASWSIVANEAVAHNIPLIIWGENPDMEYGAPESEWDIPKLNRKWMSNQPILKGKTVEDWTDESLPLLELQSLIYPSDNQLDKLDFTPIFLGYYLPWDAKNNVEVAKKYGFEVRKEGPIIGLYDYADLDCMNIVIHHYFKFLKFGFNRVTDNACNEIRKGRMSRDEAIDFVKSRDGILPPAEYIEDFCNRVGISVKHFWEIAEKYRNQNIWFKDSEGLWQLRGWIGGKNIPDEWRNPLELGKL